MRGVRDEGLQADGEKEERKGRERKRNYNAK